MNKHTVINILFAICVISMVYLYGLAPFGPWWFVVVGVLYSVVLFLGSYFIQLDFFVTGWHRGDKSKRRISLTFDDGPMEPYTAQVLDILREEGVVATFFVIGERIAGHESLLKRMDAEGHLIGNHSDTHGFWFSMQTADKIAAEIAKCEETVREVTGRKMRLFRPPYGVTNPLVAKAIRQSGLHAIGWTLRTYDTTIKDRDQLYTRAIKNLKNGDIVLMHEWGTHTIGILRDYIKYVRSEGFEIVRLDELLGIEGYEK